jgi:hypothetical protein
VPLRRRPSPIISSRLGYVDRSPKLACADRGTRHRRHRDDLIAFVEVRSATTDYLTSPAITVTFGKQRRVSRAADAYLQARGHCPERIRFDVAGVSWRDGEAEIAYFENAFVPTSAY